MILKKRDQAFQQRPIKVDTVPHRSLACEKKMIEITQGSARCFASMRSISDKSCTAGSEQIDYIQFKTFENPDVFALWSLVKLYSGDLDSRAKLFQSHVFKNIPLTHSLSCYF